MPVAIYLCPSTGFRDFRRTPEDKTDDVDKDGMWDTGEGLALMDYAGVSGPHQSARNPLTGQTYRPNGGVLLSIASLIVPDKPQILGAPRIKPSQITDGLSQTLVIGEVTGRAWDPTQTSSSTPKGVPDGAWMYGKNVITIRYGINRYDNKGNPAAWTQSDQFYSDHPGGVHILYCDASVHFVSEDIDVQLLQSLASRAGEEVVPQELIE
jgi:prepilin-type processing-associated H-X9-DG protein